VIGTFDNISLPFVGVENRSTGSSSIIVPIIIGVAAFVVLCLLISIGFVLWRRSNKNNDGKIIIYILIFFVFLKNIYF
jgi:LPXTG-motif cell wall-anchored protein